MSPQRYFYFYIIFTSLSPSICTYLVHILILIYSSMRFTLLPTIYVGPVQHPHHNKFRRWNSHRHPPYILILYNIPIAINFHDEIHIVTHYIHWSCTITYSSLMKFTLSIYTTYTWRVHHPKCIIFIIDEIQIDQISSTDAYISSVHHPIA